MASAVVAIIGRPNVGKSTLFNRLLRRRQAIVDEQEGITRDRIYGEVEWSGCTFTVVDTGGFVPHDNDVIVTAVRRQAELAMREADLVLFLVDGREGITSTDAALADLLRRASKPHILVVNKIDNVEQESSKNEFYSLRLAEMITISALHGRNTGDMLDLIVHRLACAAEGGKGEDLEAIRVAIVGMPNVGKSSIANALLRQEKSIVTDVPGTTRDSVDSALRYYGKTFILVDTAGLKKKSRVQNAIEYYSMVRTIGAIDRAHVVLVVLDATKRFGRQDQQIVRQVIDRGRGLILVVNKWDLVVKDTNTFEDYKKTVKRSFAALTDYPILFVSARTKKRLSRLLTESERVFGLWRQEISTSILNQVLRQAVERYQPPAKLGKSVAIKYVTQVSHSPPRFAFFCNFPQLIVSSYESYLENQFRLHFDFSGVPIKMSFRKSL